MVFVIRTQGDAVAAERAAPPGGDVAGVSQEQREQVVRLLQQGAQSVDDIARAVGLGPLTVRAMKAHMTMGTYSADGSSTPEELEDAAERTFRIEKDLQAALRSNIAQLEPGLFIVDGGKEAHVEAGYVDILAQDPQGRRVVIELKAGTATPEALTQLLAYMGTADAGAAGVRGILVASDFHPRLVHAVKAVGNVTLHQYGYRFTFREPTT